MRAALLFLAGGNANLVPALPIIGFCALWIAVEAALRWTEGSDG